MVFYEYVVGVGDNPAAVPFKSDEVPGLSGKWSGLPDQEIDELARLAMYAICEEWDPSDPGLPSSVVYERLVAEGVEVPDGAMADALGRLKGWLITPYIGGRPPRDEAGMAEFRRHGGMTIGDVNREHC